MSNLRSVITVSLLVCLLVSLVGPGYARAIDQPEINFTAHSTDNQQLVKGAMLGGLVSLGIWGLTKWLQQDRREKYKKRLARGKMYFNQGDYNKAITKLKAALDLKDTTAAEKFLLQAKESYQQQYYQHGSQYLQAGKWKQAYQAFSRVKKYGRYRDTAQKYNQAYQHLRRQELTKVAVLEFADSSNRFDLGGKATSLFTARLLELNPKLISIIECEQLNRILQQKQLTATGLAGPRTVKQIGEILQVDYLITGEVIGGDITQSKDKASVEVYYTKEDKTQYTVRKLAYTQVFFKLLDADNASVVLSQRVKKEKIYKNSYYAGESIIIPSDEELIDQTMTETVEVFARQIADKFSLD